MSMAQRAKYHGHNAPPRMLSDVVRLDHVCVDKSAEWAILIECLLGSKRIVVVSTLVRYVCYAHALLYTSQT